MGEAEGETEAEKTSTGDSRLHNSSLIAETRLKRGKQPIKELGKLCVSGFLSGGVVLCPSTMLWCDMSQIRDSA